MIKFLSIILAIGLLNGGFLEVPEQTRLVEKAQTAEGTPEKRELIEPVVCTLTVVALTVVALTFLIGFVVGRSKWRRNADYQEIVYKINTTPAFKTQASLHKFFTGVYVKDLVNRCLSTVRATKEQEDLTNQNYYVELCLAWGHFTNNHALVSIKLFDVTYSLQYFDLFLARETIFKSNEQEPETVRARNKRFIQLITSEIEGQRAGRDARFPQTPQFRLMNSFYGGFWELIFHEMFDTKLAPVRTHLSWPESVEVEKKTSCFGLF